MFVSVEQICQTVVTLNQMNVGGKEKSKLFNWNIIETLLNVSGNSRVAINLTYLYKYYLFSDFIYLLVKCILRCDMIEFYF